MAETFIAKVRAEGKITIPKELRINHKINQGDYVTITIKKPEWWEFLNWDEMGKKAFDRLPPEIQQKIREATK